MTAVNGRINDIFLGKTDGANEAKQVNFEDLFYDGDGWYDELNETDKFLVTGRKGTGKSILINYFSKKIKSKKNISEIYQTSRVMERKLSIIGNNRIKDEEMGAFWHFILLDFLLKLVLKEVRGSLFSRGKELQKTVKELDFGLQNLMVTDKIDASIGANSNHGISANIGGVSEETKQFNKIEYYDKIDELQDALFKVIKNSRKNFYMIFDDLDELSSKFAGKEYFIKMIKSFLTELKNFNEDLYSYDLSSKVIATLRTDVINQLQIEGSNLAKLTKDSAIEMKWSSPRQKTDPWTVPIAKMVLNKIRVSLPEYKTSNNRELYKLFFEDNTKRKLEKTAIDYILQNSFGRPRDIVLFLSDYKKMFPEDNRFGYRKLTQSLGEFSKDFYNELQNEMSISSLKDEQLEFLDKIRNSKVREYTFEEINNLLYNGEKEKEKLEKLITSLYKLGILGVVKGDRGNKTYEFYYRDGAPEQPSFANRFLLHAAIKRYLSI